MALNAGICPFLKREKRMAKDGARRFIKWGRASVRMDGFSERRRRLFSGAPFSSAIFHNGDAAHRHAASFAYFSGCGADGAYLVLRKGGGAVFTSEMNLRQAREGCAYPVRMLARKRGEAAAQLRKACGGGKTAFAPHEMSAAGYLALRRKAGLALVDASERIGEVRARKSAGEVRKIASAARVAKRILDGLCPWDFATEAELSSHLKLSALGAGCRVSFEPIVATGGNSAKPHSEPSGRKLGDFVLVDFGVRKDGYCSDFTRCYFRREGMREEKEYWKCKSAYQGIVEGLQGCRQGKDVALLAERLLGRHGLPPLIHSIGHGIGMEVHEFPRLWKKSRDSLEGAALAIEPAAYFARFGVRYEGMVAHADGEWREI